jgi:hypothetical protein
MYTATGYISYHHQGYLSSEGKVILKSEDGSNIFAETLFFTYLHDVKARILKSEHQQIYSMAYILDDLLR